MLTVQSRGSSRCSIPTARGGNVAIATKQRNIPLAIDAHNDTSDDHFAFLSIFPVWHNPFYTVFLQFLIQLVAVVGAVTNAIRRQYSESHITSTFQRPHD